LQPLNFPFDVPDRFAEILHWFAFLLVPQQVLESIANTEVFVLAKLYCLNPRGMGRVMWRMVYWVTHCFVVGFCPKISRRFWRQR
jgi:hypothetical protein